MALWFEFATAQCPLRVERAEWNDPVLLLGGAEWSLSASSSWRVVARGAVEYASDDREAAALVASLAGRVVLSFGAVSARVTSDAALELDDGRTMEVFATALIEPWVLKLPRPPVLLPSPSERGWGEIR